MKYTETQLQKVRDTIHAKVSYEPNTGCWLWTGALSCENGYAVCSYIPLGGIGLESKSRGTNAMHRLSYIAFKGDVIPDGMVIMHTCDVRSCVNPDHLMIGTKGMNNTDRARKGRSRPNFGSRNHASKLDETQVKTIRDVYADRGFTMKEIGQYFGVNTMTIQAIISGRSWGHLK